MEECRNAYGKTLAKLALENENIVVLDADLSKSTKTAEVQKVCPERHFNAGIAECNMVGMAAGLAASGKIVYASSFAIFLAGRAFEVIRNSVAYPNLNVKLCATHAGLSVGEDGASHQAVEDVAIMRAVPNMRVFVPADQYEAAAMTRYLATFEGPAYMRMGRGKVEDVYTPDTEFDFTKISVVKKGSKVLLVAMGMMVAEAIKAAEVLKEKGIEPTIVNASVLKPFDSEGFVKIAKEHDLIVTMEEHSIYGGLYSTVAETLTRLAPKKVVPIAIMDTFGESGKGAEVLAKYGMTCENVVKTVLENI
ncbi:MAG: transketolase family protein [Erysipelotrichaceae bacterium]|nr:transketolase family protein [Erysipelotrichaceae bacterium]